MVNKIVQTITFLVALGTKAVAALLQHGAGLNMSHSEAADLSVKLAALTTANTAHKETLLALKSKNTAVDNAVETGRRFMMVVRESLKPVLGVKYSKQWTAVGFVGGLVVPRSADPLINALQVMQGYLTAHPIPDAGVNLTAARAGVLKDTLSDLVAELAEQKTVVGQALTTRNQKAKEVEGALRTVLSELHQVLPPMDARWLAFGFLRPGQKQSPEIPTKVSAILIGANAASVKWEKAARAEYYRIWKKVIGVDTEYVSVGSPADLDFTLENLPAGSQIEIVVAAVNNGGISAYSQVVIVQTT